MGRRQRGCAAPCSRMRRPLSCVALAAHAAAAEKELTAMAARIQQERAAAAEAGEATRSKSKPVCVNIFAVAACR